jgi:hypothetical protein
MNAGPKLKAIEQYRAPDQAARKAPCKAPDVFGYGKGPSDAIAVLTGTI